MLENLKHQVNFPALFIVLGIVVGVGALGLWLVHKSTGRPIREMLALLAAAFVIIAFMFPLVLIFDEWSRSPDLAIREFVKMLITIIILPIAFVVWRFFTGCPNANAMWIRVVKTTITMNQSHNLDPNDRRTTIFL